MLMSRWPFLVLAAIPLLLGLWRPASPTFSWWTTDSLEKIHPSDSEPRNGAHAVKIYAARNEFEPFQIVLRAEGQNLDNVDVKVTDLRGDANVISAEKYISIYHERYLNLTTPSSIAGGVGEWPDPLVPRVDRYYQEKRTAFPFRLTAGRTEPIWIEVYVPPSTPAGSYSGKVQVSFANRPELSIPVNLEVWNFELPSTSSLATAFGFSGNTAVRAHYGRYTNDQDVYDLTYIYQKAALWHRLSLDGAAGVSPTVGVSNGSVQIKWNNYDRVLEPFMNGSAFSVRDPLYGAKATSVALRTPPSLTSPEQQIQFWQQTAAHFRQKGWFDRLFNYVWDEPKAANFEPMAKLARTVHQADPTLKNLVTAPLHPDWDFIDIWTAPINCFEPKPNHPDFCNPMAARRAYDSQLAKGKNLWWYQACGSHGCFIVGGDYFKGWPSYMIDDAPVRNRIMEWLTWKYDIHGELYFSMNEAYVKKSDPWKDVHLFGGNGDGTLFYPGRPDIIGGHTNIPIESIRLKLIREGLEDYEYLNILTKLAGYDAVAGFLNGFIRNTYDYDQDPKTLYAVREKIGREISKLSTVSRQLPSNRSQVQK